MAFETLLPILLALGSVVSLDAGAAPDLTEAARSSWTVPSNWWQLRPYGLPLNNPAVVPAAEARFMRPDDLVVGLLMEGSPRAYPWWILTKYHIVNDTFEGVPIYLALCEVCSGAAAFRAVAREIPLDFHICGLRNGTFEVCDFETLSRWHPFSGRCLEGTLKGTRLGRLPVYHVRWGEWTRDHPTTDVVVGTAELRGRSHGHDAAPGTPGMPPFMSETLTHHDPRLPENELVLGLLPRDGGRPRAYPISALRKSGGFLQDDMDGWPVAIVVAGEYQVGAFTRRSGSDTLELRLVSRKPLRLHDRSGTVWNAWGEVVSGGPSAAALEPADGYLGEWYEWIASHPDSELWMPVGTRAGE